jgi:signal recognition particle subunit SRP54
MREVRRALLEADVNLKVAKDFIDRVAKQAMDQKVQKSIKPGQLFIKIIRDELAATLGGVVVPLQTKSHGIKPLVILLSGLQGGGKTTTAAKLASYLKNVHHGRPLLVGADLQRPAAVEQLRVLAGQVECDFYSDPQLAPVDLARASLKQAAARKCDSVIIDTAGRLHVDADLMTEINAIKKAVKPEENLFIADGMTGQDAVNSVRAFNTELQLTGVILTKMDGDARGGAALSIRSVTDIPIKLLASGEQLDSLEVFHPERLANRILGMGDLVSFVEEAQVAVDVDKARKLEEQLRRNEFTFEDMKAQLQSMNSMGGIGKLAAMLPGKLPEVDPRQMRWTIAIIDSMTIGERRRPQIINGSRRKRIARGSGRSVMEVNTLLKNFHQMKKMFKRLKKGGPKALKGLLGQGMSSL